MVNAVTEVENVSQGVSVLWLAQVFSMSVETVRQRLAQCPIKSTKGRGSVYDLKTAAGYLIEPAIDIEQYLKTLKVDDLPVRLRREYWDTLLKQQKFEEVAGHLWRTEDVLEALMAVFGTVKSTVQLWPDTVHRQAGLREDQWDALMALGDGLLEEIYQELLETIRGRSTPSVLGRLKAMNGKVLSIDDRIEAML